MFYPVRIELAKSESTARFPEAVVEFDNQAAVIKSEFLLQVADFLKNSPDLSYNYLTDLTAVDYYDYFEVVYHLSSLVQNKILALKVRCSGRENLQVPSVTGLWKGADFMEREIFDLLGISFAGHPNLKRIFCGKVSPVIPCVRTICSILNL